MGKAFLFFPQQVFEIGLSHDFVRRNIVTFCPRRTLVFSELVWSIAWKNSLEYWSSPMNKFLFFLTISRENPTSIFICEKRSTASPGLCPKTSLQDLIPRCRSRHTLLTSRYIEKCEIPKPNHESQLLLSSASPERGTLLRGQRIYKIPKLSDFGVKSDACLQCNVLINLAEV